MYYLDKVIVPNIHSEVVFNFKKDEESGLRYFISLKCKDEQFDLHSKPILHCAQSRQYWSSTINYILSAIFDI